MSFCLIVVMWYQMKYLKKHILSFFQDKPTISIIEKGFDIVKFILDKLQG